MWHRLLVGTGRLGSVVVVLAALASCGHDDPAWYEGCPDASGSPWGSLVQFNLNNLTRDAPLTLEQAFLYPAQGQWVHPEAVAPGTTAPANASLQFTAVNEDLMAGVKGYVILYLSTRPFEILFSTEGDGASAALSPDLGITQSQSLALGPYCCRAATNLFRSNFTISVFMTQPSADAGVPPACP